MFSASKCVVVCLVLLFATAAWPATKYPNLDSSTLVDNGTTGWGSCVTCAGGSSSNAVIESSPFWTSPSVDGASRDFSISGDAYSNALWWYKVGPNDSAANFQFDFWLNVGAATQSAQALEFDTFQFVKGRQYMFGTQCDYASKTWDLWNGGSQQWVHSSVACKQFVPNTWYHITLNFHRSSSDQKQHYDSLMIVQYSNSGRTASRNWYPLNQAYPSGLVPPGWSDNLGVQFQMDIGASGAQMQQWVDEVSLTAW